MLGHPTEILVKRSKYSPSQDNTTLFFRVTFRDPNSGLIRKPHSLYKTSLITALPHFIISCSFFFFFPKTTPSRDREAAILRDGNRERKKRKQTA